MKFSRRIGFVYLADHAVEAWLALAAAITGIDFFLEQPHYERTAIGQALHPWDYGWTLLYTLGGLLALLGLLRLRPRDEAAGLVLIASAFAVNLIATIAVAGAGEVVGELVLALLVVACLLRVWRLSKL